MTPDGTIATVAGDGRPLFAGDGGPATSASLRNPYGVAVDGKGNLYIADTFNYRIRMVTPDGMISTVAGNGVLTGDSAFAANSTIGVPYAVAVDGSGTLYIADGGSDRIYRATPDGGLRLIGGSGRHGFDGDGGPAWNGSVNFPWGIAADRSGRVYFVDSQNNRVRVLTPR